ncbi:MAG: ComEA family DNA-binding protein [Synergistaceae bacterium]|nr:ComEA family DNA-binding protein [Synergistaceae bacterium]
MQAEQTEQKSAAKQAADGQLVLYITGAVPRPGVYKLGSGARVYNLAEAAGGLLPGASPAVNMAAVLQDGDHVHIPSRSEAKSVIAPVSTPAPTAPAGRSGGTAKTAKPEPEKTGLIDVNTASAEALVSVNGIGPSLAGRIIEYRTLHGPFNSVDELRKVKGIGAKTLEAIRGRLTVGR